jgi:hypothetical protein
MRTFKNSRKFYCARCWQQFDRVEDHDAGSYLSDGTRLNGHCSGDVREVNQLPNNHSRSRKSEALQIGFDSAPAIKL